MSKILYPSLTIISTALVLVAAVFFLQTINAENSAVEADGVVSYNETWTATGGVYGYVVNPGYTNMYMSYSNGVPSAGTYCGYGLFTSYGYGGFSSCQFSPTQWSVTGTINSGTSGVKRYFLSNTLYHSSQLSSISSSACNNDANNPGGFYHVYFNGAGQTFVSNGTTVQGPYGTGIAGQDNYIGYSNAFWSTRSKEYSRFVTGGTLGGMSYIGVADTNARILCVED